MNNSYKELKSLFISDVSKAINESQQIICSASGFSSFSDFYNYHLQHSHISTCQKEWTTKKQMSIHCANCSIAPNSCFCLECFLNSNHQGHEYIIKPNSLGNCDCGDLEQCKRSGFCTKHQGLEEDSNPENYLDEKLRTVLTDTVFKAAFASLTHYFDDDGENVSLIFQFLTSFLKFGDGFRRLLAISLTKKIHIEKIFDNIYNASTMFNYELKQFCGLLTNDQFFKNNFATINYKITIEQTLPLVIKCISSDDTNENLNIWDSFWFHSYSLTPFQFNIDHYNWDWVKFGLQASTFIKEVLVNVGNSSYNDDGAPDLILANIHLKDAATLQPNEQTQSYFDQLFSQILTTGTKKGVAEGVNDTIILTSYKKEFDDDYFNPIIYFNYFFYDNINCFVSKKNLKFDKMFEALEKTVDISQIFLIGKNVVGSGEENENDKFVSRFIKKNVDSIDIDENNYKSFHNGASFFISYPLFYSFLHVFRNDQMNRIKIARFFSMKKYQSLRIKLGILAVKNLLAFVCLHQSLTAKENAGAIDYLNAYIDNPNSVNIGIPLIIPALQLLIGLQCTEDPEINEFCLKEFFAFEIAREIGVFDDFTSEDYEDENIIEKEKQMIFSFLYLMILLVVERTLFHFDGMEFIKEQIIFGLKSGVTNLNNLKDMFDIGVVGSGRYMMYFNKIIVEVATAREKTKNKKDEKSGEQDLSFVLKETIEHKNISAINSINEEKVIMNDEISKHPNELIKIHNFEPEETFFFNQSKDGENENDNKIDSSGLAIKLKDLLMTPTVLAIVYHTLRSDSESNSQKVELNDHLAMNILILISKFVEEEAEKESNINESTVINYDSTVADLISQFKRVVFNYRVDEEQNATIQNTLTKKTFNSLLKMKIGSKTQTPRSFIEILLEKGEIGKNVLNQMNVEFEGAQNQESKKDISKMKKMRANKLKEEIMNHYKAVTASFNVNDDQNDETLAQINTEAEVCSICSTEKEDEILVFPLFIYRTKLPFIFDKPPVVKMPSRLAAQEVEVFEDEAEFDDSASEDEEEEEEENELEDPEDIFARYLQDNPGLDITDDLDEDQVRERQMIIESVYQTICDRYNQKKHELEAKKTEREQLKLKRKQEQQEEKMKKMKALENPDMLVERCCSPGNPFVIQFNLCQHLVHCGCVKEENFTCPIDRSFKNGFLPNINDLPKDKIFVDTSKTDDASCKNLTQPLQKALLMFMETCSSFIKFSSKGIDFYIEMIKSISGLISTFEIRLRRLPDSLDSKKNKMLSRNLFLTVWYTYQMNEKPEMKTDSELDGIESRMSVFQRFIKKLIECDDPENKESFKAIVSSFISSFISEQNEQSEKELFLFLRRVCLSYHFLLLNYNSSDDEKFIDWDEILSIQSLSNEFNVSFKSLNDEFELKPFNFSKIPSEFLRFGQAPYNFPVDQTHKLIVFNILDYNFLIRHFDHFSDADENDVKTSDDYSKEIGINNVKSGNLFMKINYSRKNYPSVLLCIGSMASTIVVINGKRMTFLRPIYLDRYGCADVGYKRGQPLFLNEDRYERFMDEILSGDFSSDLDKI